jgi:putative membrane-bound dehydrogenase-like protein
MNGFLSVNPILFFDKPMSRSSCLSLFPFASVVVCLTLQIGPLNQNVAEAQEKIGVRVPKGFEVSLYANDDLAHDIYSMTIDSLGRVVVSGAGYVRILIDEDGNGKADSFKQFADGPRTGAQGMYFLDRDLICTGDAGLLRYRDQNKNDRADGPPDIFLKMKTGSEHHVHSVQKGPDGWWYLIAGNNAGITGVYATLPTSPVQRPQSGVLMRLKPDLSGGEIISDGFRNAYDFAFNHQGDVFVFDSDGERDVSLPWYRPTRVFHSLPATHAGWISRSWKRPDDFLDMPPVVASFGRGSPTGTVCYRHRAFPEKYHNAIFVMDWTFGRVMALPLDQNGSTWKSKPVTFMTGIGQFGFAPTDIAVGPDGSLYVSAGGRGTRGRVYRITHKNADHQSEILPPKSATDKLVSCLRARQPSSSWSRTRWVPVARELGPELFRKVALNEGLSTDSRIRAIEILTELFGGLDGESVRTLANSTSPQVKARAVWSLGRIQSSAPKAEVLLPFLLDSDPLVSRFALEALLGATEKMDFTPLLPAIAERLEDQDRFVRQTAARVLVRLPQKSLTQLQNYILNSNPQTNLSFWFGHVLRDSQIDIPALEIGMQALKGNYSSSIKLEAARLMQLALGDVGPTSKRDLVFDSYAGQQNFGKFERTLDPYRSRLASIFPTGNSRIDIELTRLLAMLKPYNRSLLNRILAKITADSSPVDDIHYLIVAARIPVDRSSDQSRDIANALVSLERKIKKNKLNQDSNWDDRIGELYRQHVKLDPVLPISIIKQPAFGRPGHVQFMSELPSDYLSNAVAAFVKNINNDKHYPWTTDVVFVLGESKHSEHRQLVRNQYENFTVRSAVLMVLSQSPQERDRKRFVEGLDSSQLEVLEACLKALKSLPATEDPQEQVVLLQTLRRLGENPQEFKLREKVVELLQRNSGEKFGFVFGKIGYKPQKEVINKWTIWVHRKFPEEATRLLGGDENELKSLRTELTRVAWEDGNSQHGKELFTKRACAQCHGSGRALGPDLSGVTRRFSREDFFTAIIAPNRDVSPRYQTIMIQTKNGKTYSGLAVYESVDGLILRNSTNQTFRIEADEIEQRRILKTSLMPKGLLKDLKPEDLADLYTYIQSLAKQSESKSASQDATRRQ